MLNSKTLIIMIIIGVIITLILGSIVGIIIDHSFLLGHHHRFRDWTAKDIVQEELLARLSRKLDLTRPQIQAIGGILRVQAMKIKEIKDEFHIKIMEIKKETFEKIRPHLTPDQQEKYNILAEHHRKRWEKICRAKKF